MKPSINNIFNISSDREFKQMALEVFNYQAKENEVYKKYINSLKINIDNVWELNQIPFLPIEFFKTHKIITNSQLSTLNSQLFTSSGTTGSSTSKHYVNDVSIYEKSYLKTFELCYGNIDDYCVLALLPSYLERDGSSLIYMVDDLIKKSKHPESRFYLNKYSDLINSINKLEQQKQKTILLGVTYALLDLIEHQTFHLRTTIIMETGGMKGKRKELVREELHEILCKGFGVDAIHSEYGMTELLSQAYSLGNGIFNCPPWMQVMIRDINDPFAFLSHNKTGGINVIDLANINSCSFIATQDLGKIVGGNTNNGIKSFPDDSFEVLGRFDNSDIRGCNLLVE
jgi:phenylacetate-coenzyme A ligase PaaK-like adenylate-forming protein